MLLCHTTKVDAPRLETIEMRITILQIVTCCAHILDDNPQKVVNPDQTQYNPGFRSGHLEKKNENPKLKNTNLCFTGMSSKARGL